MRWRRLLLLGLLLFACGMAQAQVRPLQRPGPYALNTSHPLARGLLAWWIVLPPTQAGPTWWNRLKLYPGALTNMGSGSGWGPTTRASWYGEMRFDGSDDRVSLGDLPVWDFANMTFTVHLRFRSTSASGNAMLITRRDTSSAGGWFLRHGSTGALTARIYGSSSANLAAQWISNTTGLNNGAWHSATIIYTTDMTTVGGNLIVAYIDGALDAGTFTNPGPDPYNLCISFCAMQLGDFLNGGAPLAGAMDDVRFWTRGLSAPEVQALHRATPPTFGGLLESPEVVVGQATPATKRRVVIE